MNCIHGPEVYDVTRPCPVIGRLVRETSPACEKFEARTYPGEQVKDERGSDDGTSGTLSSSVN